MRKRTKALLVVLVAAGALAVLVVAADASGSSPQQVLSGAFGGPGSYVPPPQSTCCGYGHPCATGTTYWRWCGCYPPLAQGGSSGPQVIPCLADGCSSCCYPCYPPPCTGVCPVNNPPTPAG